jgi:DNA-binding IclR family transcriptional regulator
MELTFEELSEKTVTQLREVAENIAHDAVHGYSTMHKEELLPALCEALGIEAHVHHEVVGINKSRLKAEIRELQGERDTALAAGDRNAYKTALRGIHRRKGELRRHTI